MGIRHYLLEFILISCLVGSAPALEPAQPILSNITIRGHTVLTKVDIVSVMQSKQGSVYNSKLFEEDLARIIRIYRQRGYAHARLSSWVARSFPDGIYVSLEINEGRIGEIKVIGNTRTNTRVILQELLFQIGDLYNEEDRLESERILRKKQNLGNVEIYAHYNRSTRRVDVIVQVSDRWTLFPSASMPRFGGGELDLILALTDTNIAGQGQIGRIRYVRDQDDSDIRHFFSMLFLEPRLFSSHWEFMGNFTQNQTGDSWEVRLRRPFYSLTSRWAAELNTFDQIGTTKWYRNGEVLDEFRSHIRGQNAGLTYAIGHRHSQVRFSGWYVHRRDNFAPLRPVTEAQFEDTEAHLLGTTLMRHRTRYIQDVFVDKMGETEDIQLGWNYGLAVGKSFGFLGDHRREIVTSLSARTRQAIRSRAYIVARVGLSGSSIDGAWRDMVLSSDVRYLMRDFLRQNLVLRLKGEFAFRAEGREQLILGTENGLRGYAPRAFDGERLLLLNAETRRVFVQHPLVSVGGALFMDVGYIWRSGESLKLMEAKRSIGLGLRIGIPQLSGAPVYRLDFAWPLDSDDPWSLGKSIVFSMHQLIQIRENGD